MSEKLLQQKIVSFCKKSDILCFKFASPSQRGVPDLILFGGGRTLLLEVKNPNGRGRVSALQARMIERINEAGVPAYVVSDYERATQIIAEQFDREPDRSNRPAVRTR